MFTVLVTGNVQEQGLAILREFAQVITLPEPAPAQDIIRHMPHLDAILHKIGILGPDELRHQTKLQIIARHGVGLDYLNLDYIRTLGIPVSTTTTANSNAVAEATVGFMLNIMRGFNQGDDMLKKEQVWQRERLMGRELKHLIVGLVGYGRIGHLVAKYLSAFGSTILVYDPYPQMALDDGRTVVSFDELVSRSDIISLHCPLTPATKDMINVDVIAKTKPGVAFVNTARGSLINKEAFVAALRSGHIRTAAVDSFDHEPPNYADDVFSFSQVLTTPHLAAMTLDAQVAMGVKAAEEIRRVLVENKPPTNNVLTV